MPHPRQQSGIGDFRAAALLLHKNPRQRGQLVLLSAR